MRTSKIFVRLAALIKCIADLWTQIERWREAIKAIIKLVEEMNAMWTGDANDAFKKAFIERDIPRFQNLLNMLCDYKDAGDKIAAEYSAREDAAAQIVG